MTTPNKFHVTLPALRKAGACVDGYNRLVRTLQGNEFNDADAGRETYIRFAHKAPISILAIIESNGLDDALWALRCIENSNTDRDVRLFAVWCGRQVSHLLTDPRSTNALDVAERHANGQATDTELDAARDAARAAARDAAWDAAWAAARAAAWAAAWDAAWDAASAAARAAASAAASAAARAAARAAASAAAWYAARDAARDAAWDDQKNKLIEMLEAGSFKE